MCPSRLLRIGQFPRKPATVAKLIYSVIMSLDGYIADKKGNFDWAEPDEEVHSFINELERPVGTYLYGRRMYEVMAVWQTMQTHDEPSCIAEFANMISASVVPARPMMA